MPCTVALFDLDGCLIDTEHLIVSSFQHTVTHLTGSTMAASIFQAWLGEPLKVTFARLFPEDPALQQSGIDVYRKFNSDNHDALVKRVEGMEACIEALHKKGVKLAVVTSKIRPMALRGLEACGLAKYFPVVVGLDCCEHHKPHPGPAELALQLLNCSHVPRSSVAFIGDAPTDILCGHNAGCGFSVAVRWSVLDHAKLEAARPTHWCATPEELCTILSTFPPLPPHSPPPPSTPSLMPWRMSLSSSLVEGMVATSSLPSAASRATSCQALQAWVSTHLLPAATDKGGAMAGVAVGGSGARVVACEEVLLCCGRLITDASTHTTALRVFLTWVSAGGMALILSGGDSGSSGGGTEDSSSSSSSSSTTASTNWPTLLQTLVSMPDRAARGCGVTGTPLPSILTPEFFYSLLEMEVCKGLGAERQQGLEGMSGGGTATMLPTGRLVGACEKLCRLGRGKSLGSCWGGMSLTLLTSPTTTNTPPLPDTPAAAQVAQGCGGFMAFLAPVIEQRLWCDMFEAIVTAVGAGVLEGYAGELWGSGVGTGGVVVGGGGVGKDTPVTTLSPREGERVWKERFSSALHCAIGGGGGDTAFLPPTLVNAAARHLLLHTPLQPFLLTALVHYFYTRYPPTHFDALALAQEWGSQGYLTATDARVQVSGCWSTVALCNGAPPAAFLPTSPLLALLMEGVHGRLDHPVESVRRGGLRVAEAFSGRMGGGGGGVGGGAGATASSSSSSDPLNPPLPHLSFEELRGEDGVISALEQASTTALVSGCPTLQDVQDLLPWSPTAPPSGHLMNALFHLARGGDGGVGGLDMETPVAAPPSTTAAEASDGGGSTNTTTTTTTTTTVTTTHPSSNTSSIAQLRTPPAALLLARSKALAYCPGYLAQSALVLSKWRASTPGETGGGGGGGGGGAPPPPSDAAALACLSTLHTMIRCAGEDEGEGHAILALTPHLLATLLSLDNRCGWVNFDAWRWAALTALCSCAAPLASTLLLSRLVHGDVGGAGREEIVDLMVGVAWELGGRVGGVGHHHHQVIIPPPPWLDPSWEPPVIDDSPGALKELRGAGGYVGREDGDESGGVQGVGEEGGIKGHFLAYSAPFVRIQVKEEEGEGEGGSIIKTSPPTPSPLTLCSTVNVFKEVSAPFFFWPLYRLALTPPEVATEAAIARVLKGKGWGSAAPTGEAWDDDILGMALGGMGGGGGGGLLGLGGIGGGIRGQGVSITAPGNESLLAKALCALGVFLEAGGVGVSSSSGDASAASGGGGDEFTSQVRALLAGAWKYKGHGDARVRRACLAAFSACCGGVYKVGDALLLAPSILAEVEGERGGGMTIGLGSPPTTGTTPSQPTLANALGTSFEASGVQGALTLPTLRLPGLLGGVEGGRLGGAHQDDARHLVSQAMELMSTPRVWDDLVLWVSWMKGFAGDAEKEPDPGVRAQALGLLQSSILQGLVLGPLEEEEG